MTNPRPNDDAILSSGAARALWTSLLPHLEPRPRSLYMVFLDINGRPLKQLIPIDDLPLKPDPEFVSSLARVVDGVTQDGPATWVLLALTRLGDDTVDDNDRSWAKSLAEHLHDWIGRYPVMLATAGGVRAIRAADWEPSQLRHGQRRLSSGRLRARPATRRG